MHQPTTTNGGLARFKFWLEIFKFVGPILLGMIVVYTTAKVTINTLEQEVIGLKSDRADLQKQLDDKQRQLDYIRDQYPPRTEITPQLQSLERTLGRIESNVNAIRNGR